MALDFSDFFKRYEAIIGEADQVFETVKGKYAENVRCEKGCSDCCHALFDLTLVTGLDLPWVADGLQRDGPHVRAPIDAMVRQSLMQAQVNFHVVYGQGLARLNNALLAMGVATEDEATWLRRESAQFALNEGRTPWLCEKCSDPDCEHRLFTGLLRKSR